MNRRPPSSKLSDTLFPYTSLCRSQRVGEDGFEAVADRDTHPPLVRRDQENDAVVLFLVADLPLAAEAVAIVGDVAPLEVADRRDDELVSGLLLEFEQLRVRSDERRVGKRGSVRVDLGGRRLIKKKKQKRN